MSMAYVTLKKVQCQTIALTSLMCSILNREADSLMCRKGGGQNSLRGDIIHW